MFGNNKQETITRINELTNEANKLNRKIFKLKTFIQSKNFKEFSDAEDKYIDDCQLQLSHMESYYQYLQERAIILKATM